MTTVRIIGDCHGAINTPSPKGKCYRDIIKDCYFSVQLGDMGFNYSGLRGIGNKHLFIPGNHDNYDALPIQALQDFGPVKLGPFSLFYARGEWSIDIKQRTEAMRQGFQKCWWEEEELSFKEMEECLDLYKFCKPDTVLTHGCPASISEEVGSPGVWAAFGWDGPRTSNTQLLLQNMFEAHQPKLWLFGHYHRKWTKEVNGTTFMCIDELDHVDFNEDWSLV